MNALLTLSLRIYPQCPDNYDEPLGTQTTRHTAVPMGGTGSGKSIAVNVPVDSGTNATDVDTTVC